VLCSMAPVVRIEPNGSQTLLLFDNAREDLENSGWLVFIQRFEGFNLAVAQQFALTFDRCRAKVGDMQLEINEEFLSSTTSLPAKGQRWFKNSKVDEVLWPLLFTSRKIVSYDRGMPVTCWVCVIFFARVVVSERLRRARRGVRGGWSPPRGGSGAAPPKFFFLGRHIFAGFGPTYYRRADIFPGRHISGTT
jgi:hypothetical protein